MQGKIIKPNSTKTSNILSNIILLIIGIVLITNSNQFVTIAFQIIGVIIILFGLYYIWQYLKLKKQFKTEDSDTLTKGIITLAIGLLVILLSSILEVGLRYILGFFLLLNGLRKIIITVNFKPIKKIFILAIIEGSIFIILGLYTIFVANAALMIIGIYLLIYASYGLLTEFQRTKKR